MVLPEPRKGLLLGLEKFFKMAIVTGFEILTHFCISTVKISALFGTGAASAFAGVLVFAIITLFGVFLQKIPQTHI